MEKRTIYHLIDSFKCKLCGQEMLFFVTENGSMIDYKDFISKMYSLNTMINMLAYRKVRFLKCLCCNKLFIIDWSKGWPEQLLDIKKLQDFGICIPKKK